MALKDYEEVKDRLPRFLTDPFHLEPRVMTRLITNPDNLAVEAGFVAELWDGDVLLSTGHAFEVRVDTDTRQVNATSWVENCETSAIGRALANGGYASGSKRPSREEMEKVERMQRKNVIKDEFAALVEAYNANATKADVLAKLGDPKNGSAALAAFAALDDKERASLLALAKGEK